MARARGWQFTANLADDAQVEVIEQGIQDCVYMVWQYEEVAHRHIQGYCYWKSAKTMKSAKACVKAWCGIEAHMEIARGTAEQNKAYCSKEESRIAGPFEMGTLPVQGARNDVRGFYEAAVKSGGKFTKEMVEEHLQLVLQYGRRMKEIVEELKRPNYGEQVEPERKLEVHVLYGDSGTGKTHKVFSGNKDIYRVSYVKGKEFSNYAGQDVVFFDEFKGQIDCQQMKEWLDVWPISVMVMYKGAMPFTPSKIFITSNHAPRDWWKFLSEEDELALSRRMTSITELRGSWQELVVTSHKGVFPPSANEVIEVEIDE